MPEGLVLNGLSLNNGTTHFLTELQLPIPAKKPEWVGGADADGEVLYRNPLVENGTLVAKVDLFLATKDLANAAIGAIVDQLEEADLNPAGIPVVWTPVNGTKSLTFYALSGEITELPMDGKAVDSNVPTVTITLKCRPGGYGALVTGPSQTTAGPTVQLTLPDIPGDMPTDEAYVVITDQSTQSRRHVEWGAEYLHYNAATSLLLDSDSLTVSGYSGALATFGAPAYDPNAAGTDTVSANGFYEAWTSMCSTGSQAHVGTFRVKARVLGSSLYGYVRLAWRAGDGDLTVNDEAYVACPSASYNVREIDLGLITIPAASAGTQSWEGIVQIKAAQAGAAAFYLDYLVLIPVEAGYGRARGETVAAVGTMSAYDSFDQTAGALDTKVAPLGGTWATSGAATDIAVSGTGYASRTILTDANIDSGRYAIVGSTNYTNLTAVLDISWVLFAPASGAHAGASVLARYVDANNWLLFQLANINSGGLWMFSVKKRVAGTVTTIYSYKPVGYVTNGSGTLTLNVSSSGMWTATSNINGTGMNVTTSGYDSLLATGGTLATGKVGIYDVGVSSGLGGQRRYNNLLVTTSPALVPAMYSGRTLEVTSSETRRQNSAGTMYGRPASYRGSRFTLNPEGAAGRTTRILAKAHRNDVDLEAEATPVTDSLKVQVFYRPRYSVVPR